MKRIASLSLDLDNKWSYMKTHGDAGWETFPSYLDCLIPRVLDFLDERKLKITFFIVGQDAALEKNREVLSLIADRGHEIGNHSFNHEPWLHLYSKNELVREFEQSEKAIEAATGSRPVGFRGPGFSLSPTVIDVLCERGYEYDCSRLPTFIAPLARAYYFFNSPEMSEEEKAKRKKLFGKFTDGFETLKPHKISAEANSITEIPVTTFPIVKTPIHASYLIYLSTFSRLAARAYWRSALNFCRALGIQPSILLHPLDFLGGDDVPELKFFPGMGLDASTKIDLLSDILEGLGDHYEILNMREHANRFSELRPHGQGETIENA